MLVQAPGFHGQQQQQVGAGWAEGELRPAVKVQATNYFGENEGDLSAAPPSLLASGSGKIRMQPHSPSTSFFSPQAANIQPEDGLEDGDVAATPTLVIETEEGDVRLEQFDWKEVIRRKYLGPAT